MNKIDTNYKSLSEIDPEVVRFYAEESRERTTGYTEPDDEGNTQAITESYTVIVLNKPDEVTYEYAESRRGRRFGEDVVKSAIAQAIEWEDFSVNHDGYIQWLADHAQWHDDHLEYLELLSRHEDDPDWIAPEKPEEPMRPVIDMAVRRAVYEVVFIGHPRDQWLPTGKVTEAYDDKLFTFTTETVEASDEEFAKFEANPTKEYTRYLKLKGVEFEGVMCSAVKDDQFGIGSLYQAIKAGSEFNFEFENGNSLKLTPSNIDDFMNVWGPFRNSFF